MQKRNISTSTIVIIIFLVLLLIGIAVVFYTFYQSFQVALQAIHPVSNMTSDLSTQVAQILHPTPTILADPVTIIHSIRSLARLETIQYSVEKVITAESGQGPFGFLFGDRLLLVAHGTVIAGLDLQKMSPKDLWVENQVLYAQLPQAEIFITALDNNQSYIYDREIGALTKGNIFLETEARQAAEKEIEDAAIEDGILGMALQNGKNYLQRLFLDLGYPDVVFVE